MENAAHIGRLLALLAVAVFAGCGENGGGAAVAAIGAKVDAVDAKVSKIRKSGKKRGGYDEEKILLCVACVNAAKDNALMPRGSEGTKLTLEDVFVFNRRKLAGNGVASLAEFKKIIHAYRARTHRTRLKKLDAARQKKSANAEKNGIIHGVSCS